MYWPRGKTWGGSSSINAMLYVRGHASDYDHWRQLGNEGWSYDDVLPYFKKAEHNERGPSEFHGVDGPLNVADQTDPLTINDHFIRACAQLGHHRNDDFNGAEQEGFGYYQVTQRGQQRWSTASAYLRPAVERNRNNVHVISNALVERIILDKDRAMGVRYNREGRHDESRAAAANHLPAARQLAAAPDAVGHRPADHLKSLGIRPLHDLPGVGGNLQDHLDAALLQFCKTRDTTTRPTSWFALSLLEGQKAPALADPPDRAASSQRPGLSAPDIQLHFLPVWWSTRPRR
jgi:choline dehydrogenase